ncbi:MAG: malonyl-CoA synthase [Gemmataceae bacterium]|nr:malonyl-CoA synthase [Gemmataceae bacterium]
MAQTFLHALQETFAKQAPRHAIIASGVPLRYDELNRNSRWGAAILQSWGVRKGDRVAICTPNKRAVFADVLAVLYAGAVLLPLNPRFTREELRFFLKNSGARVALVDDEVAAVIELVRQDLPDLAVVASPLTGPTDGYRVPEIGPDDPCLLMYSSGTTGWPKGIVHTHGNVLSSLRALQQSWRMTPDDVVLNVLPLFHIHGLCFATLLTLLTGGCLILDDFEPQRTLQQIGDCSVFMAVPTIYYRFLEQPNFRDVVKTWQKPRLFTCGSAPIRAEVLPELEAILGKPVINRYGMTEAFVITSLPLDGPWPNGSVGLPLDGVEVRVVTDEPRLSGSVVGAVQIRGPNLFRGYWKQAMSEAPSPPAPFPRGGEGRSEAAPLAGGEGGDGAWFDTGDLGFLDAAGFLTLVGRKNDLIITSGFNVYPQVVERVINECSGVRESAVLGVPDERKGERVVAVVVRDDPTLDEDRLRAFLSDRLVDYQRPKTVKFVDTLPRNAMGKVLRREMQGWFL